MVNKAILYNGANHIESRIIGKDFNVGRRYSIVGFSDCKRLVVKYNDHTIKT